MKSRMRKQKKSKCTEAITKKPVESAFALYVDNKLSHLRKRDQRIAGKRISDVLFEVEIATRKGGACESSNDV